MGRPVEWCGQVMTDMAECLSVWPSKQTKKRDKSLDRPIGLWKCTGACKCGGPDSCLERKWSKDGWKFLTVWIRNSIGVYFVQIFLWALLIRVSTWAYPTSLVLLQTLFHEFRQLFIFFFLRTCHVLMLWSSSVFSSSFIFVSHLSNSFLYVISAHPFVLSCVLCFMHHSSHAKLLILF